MQFNAGCGQVLYIGHSSEKKYSITFIHFLYAEVQIEQIKNASFIGLEGLVFEINGNN